MFETNLLSLIVNNCGYLSVRKDKQHYRLDFIIYKSKVYNLELNELLNKITTECKFYFNPKTNRYYLHGKNAIKALELLDTLGVITKEHTDFTNKVDTVLSNKELFTRSKGKKLTTEELIKLKELYVTV